MTRLDLMIHWEIDPIERLLDEVPTFLVQRAEEARRAGNSGLLPDGRLSDEEVYLAASSLTHDAIIYHLNALIDWFLLALATRILPPVWGLTPQAQSRSRGQLLKAIESHYHVNVKQLPSWDQVEQLREEANAIKYRGGSHLPESSHIGVSVFRRADTTPESLRARLVGTREWLIALWRATEASTNLSTFYEAAFVKPDRVTITSGRLCERCRTAHTAGVGAGTLLLPSLPCCPLGDKAYPVSQECTA